MPKTPTTPAAAPEPDAADDAAPGAAAAPDAAAALAQELDALTYEQARDELVDVVRRLETGGAGLEESLALWERGEALADRCQRFLDGARARLDAARGAAAPPA
ncbi:exodeoxyribonuclease VII small subunit [Kineococcus rubinsiae]|uniref:exodeoxyribonuclease VII small subunit n=1 Tax=Kineococcus rubinsiae TaxID=2609562 RepID=UPI0014320206|nr:exodeoxyribonuclease VII small subunit [Kineococcus rubinsiae]NIZ91327.1 exodeoxyribonuclease VII small subunit [Kineococcus rubinsiae]